MHLHRVPGIYVCNLDNDNTFVLIKLAEEPIDFEWETNDDLSVYIMFSSSTIAVEKEVDAYPLASFVADYGGLLGLFVGANFLECFEFCLTLFHKFCPSKYFR